MRDFFQKSICSLALTDDRQLASFSVSNWMDVDHWTSERV